MNNFFLPAFQTFWPDGVQIVQMDSGLETVVHFAHFKVRPGKLVFRVEIGGVLCTNISPKGVCDQCGA